MRRDAEKEIARRAAQRLASAIDANLPGQVEQEWAKDPLDPSQERALDPISLGGLIVSMASLGWTIYRDIKKDHEAVQKAATTQYLAGRLREEAQANGWLLSFAPEQQALIVEGVAQEIVREPL